MAYCTRRSIRVVHVVLNIILLCLISDLVLHFTTGHFLVTLHVVHKVRNVGTQWMDSATILQKPTTHSPEQHRINYVNQQKVVVKTIIGESELGKVLKTIASPQNEIILIYTSHALMNFSLNFVKVNEKLDNRVQNYLFVSDNSTACDVLARQHIPCWTFTGEAKFEGVACIKTALEALEFNFTVQVQEYDVVLLHDTLCDLNEKCPPRSCHGAVMTKEKGKSYLGGLLYLHPTPEAIEMMTCIAQQYARPKMPNKMARCREKTRLSYRKFDIQKLSEDEYFKGHFEVPYSDTIVKAAHININWSPDEAIYLMKESMLWFMEGEDYFSDRNKYLWYNNDWLGPFRDRSSVGKEKEALKNALVIAEVLNRILILPKFHCWWHGYNCLITMVSSPSLIALFPFRESSFIDNPLTPGKVRHNLSKLYLIDNTETYTDHLISLDDMGGKRVEPDEPVVRLKASYMEHVTAEELHTWFDSVNSTVLRMVSTYGLDLCQGNKTISKVCSMI